MKTEVSASIEELKQQFSASAFTVQEDGQGGAYVFIEDMPLGPRYAPQKTWMGFQISAQYPYADIYPVFMGAEVARADNVAFVAPVTTGHQFQGRAAIQISRRSSAIAAGGMQKANTKILKVLDFLENLK